VGEKARRGVAVLVDGDRFVTEREISE